TAGDDLMRAGLCEDALRLGRILAGLAPNEPEIHGLVALMEIQASRSRARVGESGQIVVLLDQDRGRGDALHISRCLAALDRRARAAAVAHGRPAPPERARRPSGETRPLRGRAGGIRARGIAHAERARARPAPRARSRVRATDVVKRPALCGAIALLFAACTVSCGRPAESVSPEPTASAVVTTPTPSPSLTTATPRPEPPVAASDP